MEIQVSICIPTYNGARWLKNCVESALSCAAIFEIIIVDDCSSDDSVTIARNFSACDSRVKVFVNEKNLGLVGNWNRCLKLASGKWIKFLFQDDTLGENAIEEMLKVADEQTELIAAKRNFIFDETTSLDARKYYSDSVLTLEKLFPGQQKISARQISFSAAQHPSLNFIGEPSTILFKKTILTRIGEFDSSLHQICDLEFCLRIGTTFGVVVAQKAKINFLVHSQSMTSKNSGNKNYVSTFLDPVRLVDLFLYSKKYLVFREQISKNKSKRLKLWLLLRCYEAKKNAKTENQKSELRNLFSQKPYLEKLSNKRFNPILFGILKMRRKSS